MQTHIIDLKPVFNEEGAAVTIDAELNFREFENSGYKPVKTVHITGKAQNKRMVVSLSYDVMFSYEASCDRCLEPVEREFRFSFEHIVTSSEDKEDEGELVFAPDFRLDIAALCEEDLFLSLPSKFLCGENCKGLCAKCGQNLNIQQCECPQKEIDPRLAALADLL